MKVLDFIENLKNMPIYENLLMSPEEDLYTFKPFFQDSSYDSHILYIGRLSELPHKHSDLSLNFLCVKKTPDEKSPVDFHTLYPHSNFIFVVWEDSIRLVFDTVADFFLAETRYTSQINRLVSASNSNRGLQYLIDEACQITHSPIIVMDNSYRILAMYRDIPGDDVFDLKKQMNQGYLTEHNLERMKRDKIYEQLRQSPTKTHYGKASDTDYCWLDALVYVHDIEVAEIGMLECDHTFTHYDFETINFLRQLISWEMQKKNFYSPTHGMMHSIFLSELLEQKFANPKIIEQRARMLNWKNSKYLYIFTVFPAEQKNFRQKAEIFSIQAQKLVPNSHWVIKDSHLIFLIMNDTESINMFLPGSPLADQMKRNNMYGIISNPFSELIDVKKYYYQTLAMREFKNLIMKDSPICFYADHYLFHIAKIISESHDLKDFYHPLIISLKDYDQTNHTKYLDTLKEYLTHIDNPAVCAQNLGIHKNTFFYRMNKLKELFPINLNDGIERTLLQFTLELMKLEN